MVYIKTKCPVRDLKPSKVNPSTRGGEEIRPGTLHGGLEEIKPGTLHGGVEEIKPGTLHSVTGGANGSSYSPAYYRTKNGRGYYSFRYVLVAPNKFEIDILSQPSYGSRDSSSHVAHRLNSARGGLKICISAGFEPRTIEKAKEISIGWAELTQEYIETGVRIDELITRKNR